MTSGKMHENEVDIDDDLVRHLVATQFPHLGELEIRAVESTGTVNAIYRLGHDFYVRLPRVAGWSDDLEKELRWLGFLGPRLSLAVPEPEGFGTPVSAYPLPWAIYRWMEGETYSADRIDDERQAASDLAQFVSELQHIETSEAPPSGRLPLRQLDEVTRHAIGSIDKGIDHEAVMASWEQSLGGPEWEGTGVWRHCDLLAPNLLVKDGRLVAVLDFGTVGIGDPAADVIAAWSVFGPHGRESFRNALDVDDETWIRARGYALHQALLIIPYYVETNPLFAATARRTVEQVLSDSTV